ncbi:MAG TPA: AAA family ATPase [Longimicrobiaceae bacterium]|jgi:hypothetical protein|nr:AAA family ATPase [Longimicrobiaceae bacterium]
MSALAEAAARLEALLAALLAARLGAEHADPGVLPGAGGDEQALAAARAAAAGALGDLELAPLDDALDGLAEAAGMDDAARLVLAAALLVNLDDRLCRAVGLLHDDVSRTRPSMGLLARMLEDAAPRAAVLAAAAPAGPLEHGGMMELAGAYGDPDAPLASREVVLHPRVLEALLHGAALAHADPAWTGILSLESPAPPHANGPGDPDDADQPATPAGPADPDETGDADPPATPTDGSTGGGSAASGESDGAPGEDDGAETVRRVLTAHGGGRRVGLLRVGPDVEAALEPARAFARAEGLAVLRVDLSAALTRGDGPDALLRAVRRESVLTGALPVWTRLPSREALADPELPRRLAHLFMRAPAPLVVHAEHGWTPPADLPLVLVPHPSPAPDFAARQALWRRDDGVTPGAADDEDARALGASFILARGAVAAARADAAASQAVLGGDAAEHLRRAAHRQSSARLVRFARRVTPRAGWEELVVPPSVLRQLREVEWRAAHRMRVFEETGFSRGRRGFLALFAGASGTGKTLAAEVIAATHGFDLYQVDLAGVVSKYIGETEKNLSQVFEDAESTHAILFFDEAEALFGKRSEVKDAHDRYANLEINYLLQRVEAYDGVVILATNLRQNMDEAFLRRLDLVVELPFPGQDARAGIWRRAFPPGVRMADEVDADELARRFRLSGGSIRNCAVDAAFRAVARDGGQPITITRGDVLLAVGREYQKLGRPVTRAEFGDAYAEVMDTLFTAAGGGDGQA